MSARPADFDPAVIRELPMIADGSDTELADRLFDLFVTSTKKMMDKLDAAFRDTDRETYLRMVHTIKSSAGRIGAMALSAETARQELALREGGTVSAEMLASVQQHFESALAALAAYRQDHAAGT